MAAKSMLAPVFLLLALLSPLRMAAAATHNVGDSLGWNIPPDTSLYSDWASNKTFLVGDILVFNFTTGQHDVTEVTRAAFDSCSASNPISTQTSGPASIRLSAAGSRHFICAFPGHCNTGQKLSVTVRSQSSSPPATTPSPAPKSSSPVSPSPSPRSGKPPKASPPGTTPTPETAVSPPPSEIAPSTPTPTTAPPPPNSANSVGSFGLFLSAGLAIAVAVIY